MPTARRLHYDYDDYLRTLEMSDVKLGERVVSARDKDAVTNPTLLVEVTSKSTEDYDRGDKLGHYQQLPSLQTVLLVSHRARRITVVERAKDGWTERDAMGGELVQLTSPVVSFAVDAVYDGITLDPV